MFSFKGITIMPAIVFTIMILIAVSVARELRPSDHGLQYQSSPPKLPPQMKEFFGSSSPASKSSSMAALPKSMNSSHDSTWLNAGKKGGDRLQHVLLVASLACGVTGAALLAASGFIYLHKRKKSPASSSSVSRDNNKAIVSIK